ncbi:hypothetical protein ACP70R_000712 [Stipagrostis hirtigluma subsp. patula]
MEIPTAVIHRLQSSLREAAGAASSLDAAPAPPFPSVADAVAAFDSGASAPASSGPRCGRCGAAGGLLRGAQSAVCVYCGSPFRDGEGEGGGIAFRDGAAYRWLLGSLGLDGSELVEFDSETTGSNKSKEAPKSGMIISDLLDLKIKCLPENKETYVSSITKEKPSSVDTLNLSGANLDSFFNERKEQATASAAPQTHAVVQEKQRTDNKSGASYRSEVHVTSKGLMGSQRTNQTEATPAFANWDADFQSSSSKVAAGDSKQPDLFKSASAAESFSFPGAGSAINAVVGTVNKTNMESTILEHPENMASASATLVEDNLSNEKVVQPILENNSGIVPEPDLEKNSVKSDQLHGKDDNEVNDDEAFDDWQDFAEGGIQGSLSHVGEHTEEPVKRDSSEIKTIDPWPVGRMGSPKNVNGDSSDDWPAFASSSGQGGGDSMKSVLGSTSALDLGGGLMTPPGETTTSNSLEHYLEPNPVDLWSAGSVKKNNTTEMAKEANDSFDDWQDFTTSGQVQSASFDQAGDLGAPKVSRQVIDMDSWFRGDIKEPRNTDIVNGNNVLDDWQNFTGSGQAQQSSSSIGGEMMDVSFEQHEGSGSFQSLVNRSNNVATNTASTNLDDFDIWQDFAKSGHQQDSTSNLGREVTSVSLSPEPAKDLDSLDLWLTSNLKETNNSESVRRIDHSSDGWQDFASFGQAQGSTEIPGEGHLGKDPSGTETLDLWASSHANEKNLEQISENDDLFDDWQDFKNSRPQETSLQAFSDASLFDRPSASGPDALVGLEFGSISPLTSSQHQKDKTESSNEAKTVQSDEQLKSTDGMQQIGDFDSLSAKWPTKIHDNNTNSKSEPVNSNVEKLLSRMHDLSFMLKDELSVPDKPVDHSKS